CYHPIDVCTSHLSSLSFYISFLFFFLQTPPPPRSTLFPYTTLFRSGRRPSVACEIGATRKRGIASRRPWRRTSSNCSSSAVSPIDRKSTRLNSSHVAISYAVFCLKKKKNE